MKEFVVVYEYLLSTKNKVYAIRIKAGNEQDAKDIFIKNHAAYKIINIFPYN